MNRIAILAGAVLLAAAPAPRMLAADADAGGRKVAGKGCITCHGRDGRGTMPLYPNLGGQSAPYLEQQLIAFRRGERRSEVMNVVAGPLSDDDIADLAAYYASLDPCTAP